MHETIVSFTTEKVANYKATMIDSAGAAFLHVEERAEIRLSAQPHVAMTSANEAKP